MYVSDIEADRHDGAPAGGLPAERDPGEPRPWYRHRAAWIALPLIGLLLIFLAFRMFGGQGKPPPPPPATVTVASPLSLTVTDWDDYTGRFQASQAVEVRPRVSGQLVGIHFKDGQVVRKGQLLFSIDPRPFTAALAESQAQVASASTALSLARAELARASRLIADQAVSAEEIDELRARVRSSQASLAAAQAQVRARRLDVEFAQVRAPVTGRVSDRRVDIGNQVGAGGSGATLLTTINALDPIYFSFEGSEALYLKHRRQDRGVANVEIRLQDESAYNWRGRVDFTDNAIDDGSGTIRGRAVIANPDYFLVPGMFGAMRLQGAAPHPALLVPDAAVTTDQARKVVAVVGADGKLAMKPVETGALVQGLRVVRSGISRGDRVVIQGAQLAQPGAKVSIVQGRIAPQPAAAAPPSRTPVASQATIAGPVPGGPAAAARPAAGAPAR